MLCYAMLCYMAYSIARNCPNPTIETRIGKRCGKTGYFASQCGVLDRAIDQDVSGEVVWQPFLIDEVREACAAKTKGEIESQEMPGVITKEKQVENEKRETTVKSTSNQWRRPGGRKSKGAMLSNLFWTQMEHSQG